MDQSEHSQAQAFSLWPIGVAVGVAFALVGLLVSWWIVAVGAVIIVLFGVAWIYDVTRERRPEPAAASERPAAILKSGVIDGMAYTLYADGSIEAELPQGIGRFASVDALRAHLEKSV